MPYYTAKRKPETQAPNVTCPILTPISFQRVQFQLEKLLCGHLFKEKAPQKLKALTKWSFAVVKYIAKKTIFAHQMSKKREESHFQSFSLLNIIFKISNTTPKSLFQ